LLLLGFRKVAEWVLRARWPNVLVNVTVRPYEALGALFLREHQINFVHTCGLLVGAPAEARIVRVCGQAHSVTSGSSREPAVTSRTVNLSEFTNVLRQPDLRAP
jgi:hypothetical protein